jgi:FkbM family methyltransferase
MNSRQSRASFALTRPDSAGLDRARFGSTKPKPALAKPRRTIYDIFEGTAEIQQLVISRAISGCIFGSAGTGSVGGAGPRWGACARLRRWTNSSVGRTCLCAAGVPFASMDLRGRADEMLLTRTPLRHRAVRKRLVHARRRAFEAMRSPRYSMPGFDELDKKLQRYLPPTGTFLEAGANDGYTWSNTYYLERFRDWRGILIEGIPALSKECQRLRPRSMTYNCALVQHGFANDVLTMTYSDLRSLIKGSEPDMERHALASGRTYEIEVRARTLDDVIDEADVGEIDFVSLDLEGFEAPALCGLSLDRHRPKWLLIEITAGGGRAAVEKVIGGYYEVVEELTAGDVLYRRR